jgi:ribosomal protein S21
MKAKYQVIVKTLPQDAPYDLSSALALRPHLCYNYSNMAIKVTRKDQGEANENIIRRFNRKVLQSGLMPLKKSQMRFSKPMSKRERRMKAIIREARKAEKTERIKLGLK